MADEIYLANESQVTTGLEELGTKVDTVGTNVNTVKSNVSTINSKRYASCCFTPDWSLYKSLVWTSHTALTTASKSQSNNVCIIGTTVYIFGSNSSSTYYKYAYKTTFGSNEYTRLTDIPFNFYNGFAIAVGNYIYLFGGSGATTTAYRYTPSNDTYTQLTNIPVAFQYGYGVVESDNNTIHLLGGTSNTTMHYTYSIKDDTYTSVTPVLPITWYYSTAVITPNDDIYIFGSGSSSSYYSYCYMLAKGSTSWVSRTSSSYYTYNGRAYYECGKIYVFGGTSYTQYVQIYDIENNSWTYKSGYVPYAFQQGGFACANGSMYFIGGSGSTTAVYERDYYKAIYVPANSTVYTDSQWLTNTSRSSYTRYTIGKTYYYSISSANIYYVSPNATVEIVR